MRTIQEYFRDLDMEKLIETYLTEYPINYKDFRNKDMSISQIEERVNKKLHDFIERMKAITVENRKDSFRGILYVHRCIKDGLNDQSYCLADIAEILSGDIKETDYGYDILPQAEIMGFLVAETEMTQRYIYELAANVMYEASFFGFEEEDKQEVVEELKKSTEEIKSGTTKYHTWEEFKKELSDIGCDFDEESSDETELHNKVVRASYDYSKYSAMKELNKIREMLNTEIENEENTDIV